MMPASAEVLARLYTSTDTSKAFLIMITLCHICCNSDVFLTFSSLKFCDKALL
jgi:hypothetical protein